MTIFGSSAWSQSNFSPLTRQMASEIEHIQQTYGNLDYYNRSAVARNRGELSTGAIALVSSDIDVTTLNRLGVRVRTKVGNIWTMDVPLRELKSLHSVEGLDYVEVDHRITPRLEESRKLSRVDEVHQALEGLANDYTGQGVVVGIIDYDFVLNHPSFYDDNGEAYRISRIWEQNLEGDAPDPYGYGVEIVGQTDILATGLYSTSEGSHGTHVAGIAGGSGNGSNGTYRGYAPDVELVFVELGDFSTDPESDASGPSKVIDAVDYIFKYAESMGKPAVINMSLGTHVGPHDGTSLLEQGLDGLAGDGKVLVAAAGNEGSTPLHASHTFDAEETMATTIIGGFSDDFFFSEVSVWGSENTDFEINVVTYDAFTGEVDSTGFISTSSESQASIGSDDGLFNGDVDFATLVVAGGSILNNRPYAYLQAGFSSGFNDTDWVILLIRASEGTVHVWDNGLGTGAELTDGASGSVDSSFELTWKSGDTQYTVGEFGTANEVITVGSYNTLYGPDFSDSDPQGAISSFSSLGPTLDLRVKPDIVAPGNRIISSVSAQDPELDQSDVASSITGNDGQTYVYGFQQGTSMAAPAVAGAIALMLQAKPDLNHEEILAILEETAAEDNFVTLETTDAGGNAKSNTWGYGKLDALAAMLFIEENLEPVADLPNLVLSEFTITNQNDETTLQVGDQAFFNLTIMNNGTLSTTTGFTISYTIGNEVFTSTYDNVLAAGATIMETVEIEGPSAPGSLTVTAKLDSEEVIEESNENDNSLEATVTIIDESTELPNLVLQEFTITNTDGESEVEFGEELFGNLIIVNNGTVDINETFKFSLMADGETETFDFELPIAAGQTLTLPFDVGIADEAGEFEFTITLDSDDQIVESDESDNSGIVTIVINEEVETGITDTRTSSLLKIYPNPVSNNSFRVKLQEGQNVQNLTSLRLISISGQSVNILIRQEAGELFVSPRPTIPGAYVLLYELGGKLGSKKVLFK